MKKILALLLAAALLVALAACGGGGDKTPASSNPPQQSSSDGEPPPASGAAGTPDGAPKYGGTATVYYPKFYNYFDPSMMDQYQFAFWYETLWTIDWGLNNPSAYNFGPGLCPLQYCAGQLAVDTGALDTSAGTLTVKLRDDVHFQDGAPYNDRLFVANDVVWSYSRLLGLNGMDKVDTEFDWSRSVNMISGISAPDDHTVVFTFLPGMANEVSLTQLVNARVNIAGPEWDQLTDAQKGDWHNAKGTGPYILTDYVPDNSMTFTRNDNYYGYDERHPENKLPYIDTINLVYIADSSQVLAQTQAGRLDWFGENGKDVVSLDQINQISSMNVGTVYPFAAGSPASIALKVCQEQFSDIRVRQAMQLAIDLQAINQYLGDSGDPIVPGLWSTALTTWSTVNEWPADLKAQFTTKTSDLAANQAKAKQLLTDAGYPDGFTFEIELDPTANLDLFQVAASYLQQIGITMNISVAPEMMQAVQDSQNKDDPRQSNGFGGGFGEYMLAAMMTGNGPMPNAYGHNDTGYLDQLDAMGVATAADEQAKIARQLDQYFPTQHWAVLVAGVQPNYDFMSSRIGGFNGEKVYYNDNMRTIWARVWINQ